MQPTLSSVMQPRTQSCPSSPRCDSGQVISSYMALGIGSRCQDQWNIWPRATLLLKIEKSFDISRLTQSPDMCLEVSWIAGKVFRLTNFCKRPIRTIYSVSAWSILAFGWLGAFNFLLFTGFQGLLGSEPNFYPQLCSPIYPQLRSPVYPQLCSPGCLRFLGEDWARPSLKIWLVRQ